jgi:hypothetical protein
MVSERGSLLLGFSHHRFRRAAPARSISISRGNPNEPPPGFDAGSPALAIAGLRREIFGSLWIEVFLARIE